MQRYEIGPSVVRQMGKIGVYQSMRKMLILVSVLVFGGVPLMMLDGCSSSSTNQVNQSVEDMAWLPDESGLVAFLETESYSEIDGSTSFGANIYHVNSNGSLGNAIGASDQGVTSDYPPMVFVSQDGKSVITPFGPNIYRVDLSSGNAANIIQNTNLYGVSAGLHYVLASEFQSANSAKLLDLYDLTYSPIKLLTPSHTRVGVTGTRALWIDSSFYALTIEDSFGASDIEYDHVIIYDIAGDSVYGISDAAALLHASAYSPGTRDLFFKTNELGIAKYNLTTGIRTDVITDDTVESFDVSADGTLLVYTSGATNNNGSYPGFAVNVSNGHKVMIASGMIVPFISPNADKVAFIHNTGDANQDQDVNELPVSLPQ